MAVCWLWAAGCASADANPESRIDTIAARLDSLTDFVTQIKAEAILEKYSAGNSPSASLDPADQGFGVIRTVYGGLTVAIDDIVPLADGSRLTLRIGNLTAADINGGTLKVRYGRRQATGEAFASWDAQLHSTDARFTQVLRSGTWNSVQVTLGGIPPNGIGHVRIEAGELPSISLKR